MTIRFSKPFIHDYERLESPISKKVDKVVRLLRTDLKHPGLNVHKMVNRPGIYEARVDVHNRVTFSISGNMLIMRRVGTHEIYRRP